MRFLQWLLFFGLTLTALFAPAEEGPAIFRYHVFKEPDSLNPANQKNSNAGYVLSQILMPYLYWQDGKFHPGLAKECRWASDQELRCQLHKNLKYSDGSPIDPKDMIRYLREVMNPKNPFATAPDLIDLVNAREILAGKKKADTLGVSLHGNELRFRLARPNQEFIFALTNPLFSPLKKLQLNGEQTLDFIGTGPYVLDRWIRGKKIILKSNPYALHSGDRRPVLEIYFVPEDSVALRLYEQGELTFLRRLPTLYIPKFKPTPEYHEIDQVRFDYFGFAKKWREQKNSIALRKAITFGFPYEELQKVYHAKPRPGCFGLPSALSQGAVCYDTQLGEAKKNFLESPQKEIKVTFSSSVDDHRRSVEWLQSHFKKELQLQLVADGLEMKVFLQKLEDRGAEFFRRGVAPSRPTCAAVLETFLPDSPDNYLDLGSDKMRTWVNQLLASKSSEQKAKICRDALMWLKNEYVMIPTGPIFFSILMKPEWKGWHLNELNQLDLKNLHFKK